MKQYTYNSLIAAVTVIISVFVINASAENWPNWRGPNGLGVSNEKKVPKSWSQNENVKWKKNVPGMGTSSPIVFGNRVYLTTQGEDFSLIVLAYSALTGEQMWSKSLGKENIPVHNLHNMSTPTPVSDGKYVWAQFGNGSLACLDFNGNLVWQKNLTKEYGKYNYLHGMGNSPLLHEGKLIIACMHQGPSYLLAIDASSGEEIWKVERDLAKGGEAMDSYSSPILGHANGKDIIILSGANHINAYDPVDGKQLWISGGLEVPHPYGRSISGPTYGEGMVVTVASGFRNQGFVLGVDPSGSGNVSKSHVKWKAKRFAPDCPTPVIYKSKVFMVRDDGMASCLDLRTGKPFWQERLFAQNIKVSPIAAGGFVYFSSGEGECKVVRASSEFEVVGHNDLEEYQIASPAISHGHLFIRTKSHLYCIGDEK